MRTLFLFFFCLIISLGSCDTFSQNSTIADVDSRVQTLKTKDKINKRILQVLEDSSFWALHAITPYLSIETEVAGNALLKTKEWYFDGDLVFYTETSWWDSRNNTVLYSEKTYHQKGHLFAWINSDNRFVNSNSAEFMQMDRECIQRATAIRENKEDK